MPHDPQPPEATPREQEVLKALAVHGTLKATALALGVAEATINAHLDHLRDKTGLHHLPQLIAWAADQP